MSDVHKWAEHIRKVRKVRESRDQRIIGIDELKRTLYAAARLSSKGKFSDRRTRPPRGNTVREDFVFIATLGQNDVHVVVRPADGRPRRHPLRKESVRAFHQDCLDGAVRWRLTPLADTLQLARRDREELEYVRECRTLVSVGTFASDEKVEMPVDPQVELCAPLLAQAWEQIQAKRAAGQLGQARFVLLLNTRRDEIDGRGLPRESGEPVAAGSLVREGLIQTLELPGTDAFEECFFLTAGDLYEIDSHNQRHLRGDAARAIDRRIRALRNAFPDALALISDIGGFPETKAVLQASVAYRFDGRFEFVRPIERGRPTAQRPRLLISPAESLNTRYQIRRLIDRGSFDAAAELARHPAGEEACEAEPWRRCVIALADFLRTGRPSPCGGATGNLLQQLSAMPRSLVVLFRIEAALRRGDCETAVRDTCTFIELALLELADRHLSQPGESCVNWNRSAVVSERTCDAFRQANPEAEYRIDGFRDRRAIATWLPDSARQPWESVSAATEPERVRRARNQSVHGRVSVEHVASAVKKLLDEKLWIEDDGERSILKAELPRPLFETLGLGNVNRLYRELTQAVRDDMEQLLAGS